MSRILTGSLFGGQWIEVDADTSDNDIEVIQWWRPGEGRWRTFVRPTEDSEPQIMEEDG